MIEERKRQGLKVSIGSTQASSQARLAEPPKYVGSHLATVSPNSLDESKTFKQFRDEKSTRSLKLKTENDRVLRMKSKPQGPKQTFESAKNLRKRYVATEDNTQTRRGGRGRSTNNLASENAMKNNRYSKRSYSKN